MKRGIIQSRGLGDIVIALPIARWYADQGDEVVWPICSEFYSSFKDTAPWVTWQPIETDAQGFFFWDTPLHVFDHLGVDKDEALNLYQYLNTVPEQTDPDYFALLKFDQYKYAVAGVPFKHKWDLPRCIKRDPDRERDLMLKVLPDAGTEYVLVHLEGSNYRASVDLAWITEQYPAAVVVEITPVSDSIFDWLGAIEGAAAVVCVDSVYANLIDQMGITGPDLYWIPRSSWDLTPVMTGPWTWIPPSVPLLANVQRVDPRAQAEARQQRGTNLQSYAPFAAGGTMPTSFMSALKPPNTAQSLLASLGKR